MMQPFFDMMMFAMFAKFMLNDMAHAFGLLEDPASPHNTNSIVTLYHGTTVDYRKLLNEGLRPISRQEIIDRALETVNDILGYLPSGSQDEAGKAIDYYRRRHRAGLYFSSGKEVAMFYAPFGRGGEAVREVANDVLMALANKSLSMEEIGIAELKSTSISCYVITVRVPVDWAMSGSKGVPDEHVQRQLLAGENVPEVRLKNTVLPDMITEVEHFYSHTPAYREVESEYGTAYRIIGKTKNTPLVSVWKRGIEL